MVEHLPAEVAKPDGPRSGFVGRERELAALGSWLEAAGQAQGRVVLVAGEPGIGKTHLLGELAKRARRQGWRVLWGRAYEPEGMPPYLPFSEALQAYIRGCPMEALVAQLGEGRPALRRCFRSCRAGWHRGRARGLPLSTHPRPKTAIGSSKPSSTSWLRWRGRPAPAADP